MEEAALRLATVAALIAGGTAPFPTMAGEFVYDSMRDDIIDIAPKERRPIIVVRTDEDMVQYVKPVVALNRVCRLIIEISLTTSIEGPDGKNVLAWPRTDAALELQLNTMGWQVWNALFGNSEWAMWYKTGPGVGYGKLVTNYNCMSRFAPPNRGAVRLAVKSMEFMVKLPLECMIPAIIETAPEQANWLPNSICQVITKIVNDGGGDFRTAVIDMGATLNTYAATQPSRHPALRRVWATVPELDIEANWPIEQAIALEWAPYTMGQATIGVPTLT